jgi:hypothetical protein
MMFPMKVKDGLVITSNDRIEVNGKEYSFNQNGDVFGEYGKNYFNLMYVDYYGLQNVNKERMGHLFPTWEVRGKTTYLGFFLQKLLFTQRKSQRAFLTIKEAEQMKNHLNNVSNNSWNEFLR